jgi:hypothetical protein
MKCQIVLVLNRDISLVGIFHLAFLQKVDLAWNAALLQNYVSSLQVFFREHYSEFCAEKLELTVRYDVPIYKLNFVLLFLLLKLSEAEIKLLFVHHPVFDISQSEAGCSSRPVVNNPQLSEHVSTFYNIDHLILHQTHLNY